MISATDQNSKQRLNPFAFPAETDALFRLLMVAALMIAVNQVALIRAIYSVSIEPTAVVASHDNLSPSKSTEQNQTSQTIDLVISLILIAGIFGAAFFHYRAHPQRLIKKNHLSRISRESNSAVLKEIDQLSQGIGLKSTAEVYLTDNLRSIDAQAFGTRGRFCLKFGKGWLIERGRNSAGFRAVALHELAHIFNKDVALSYFAKSLWSAVFWLTVIPFLIGVCFVLLQSINARITQPVTTDFFTWIGLKILYVGGVIFQVSAILLFFGLVRSKLLRVREFYADCRAAIWGALPALVTSLERQSVIEGTSKLNSFTKFWRNHPTAFERLKILKEPHRLFRLTLELPFLTGILLAFLNHGILYVLLPLSTLIWGIFTSFANEIIRLAERDGSFLMLDIVRILINLVYLVVAIIFLSAGFLLSYFIVRTLVLQLLREGVQKLVIWRKISVGGVRTLKTAAIISIGCELGYFLTPLAISAPKTLDSFIWVMAWFPVTTALIWFVLVYAQYFGVRLFKGHLGRALPRWKLRLLLLTVNALLVLPVLLQILVRVTMYEFDAVTESYLNQGLKILLIGSVLVIVVVFIANWFVVKTWQLIDQPKCNNCGVKTGRLQFPGDFCGSCGKPLAEWLFAET